MLFRSVILFLAYNFYLTDWSEDATSPLYLAQQAIKTFFVIYVCFSIAVAGVLLFGAKIPLWAAQRVIFAGNFLDGVFWASLVYRTGGHDSLLYWVLPGLIMRNAISLPRALPQVILNISICLCYVGAAVLDVISTTQIETFENDVSLRILAGPVRNDQPEAIAMRFAVLVLLSACCYGVQILLERQRRAEGEQQAFQARQNEINSEIGRAHV